MPVHIIVQSKLAKVYPLCDWPIQHPATKLIFADIDRRHRPDHHIVQRDRNRGGDLVATANPRHRDRQQRLQWIQRRESEENSNGRPERNGVRRIGDRHQGHMMRGQPAL